MSESLHIHAGRIARMDGFFKWKIGETVTHIAEPVAPQLPAFPAEGTKEERKAWRSKYRFDRRSEETAYVIMGRMADECPGGVQLHYKCRIITDGNVATNLIPFHEEELRARTPREPDDSEPAEGP